MKVRPDRAQFDETLLGDGLTEDEFLFPDCGIMQELISQN